jgi:DNA-binding beta-propeller fold protein YncE
MRPTNGSSVIRPGSFRARVCALAVTALVLVHGMPAFAEATAADRALAGDEFRRGVQAYYRGAFNDSIMIFEKALSFLPGEPLILDWLGKAYYRSGVEGAALEQWQFAVDSGYGGMLVKTRMEVVRERRTIRPDFDEAARFVEATRVAGKTADGFVFRQPVSVAACPDGTFWVSAYGSNELLRFDVNGVVLERARGPLTGFDRPFDLVRLRDGRLLVSEVAADRVSVLGSDGSYKSSFGKKGRGLGEFVGPQYIAVDDAGNVYVTDYGNARVSVFDPEGNPLFDFGKKSESFPGFVAPAGIAIVDGRVFVADSVKGTLHEFDTAGNYTGVLLPEGSIRQSESIRVWNGYLLVALPNRVMMVDPASGASFDAARLGNAPARVTGAIPDANGNLILTDYKGNALQIVTRMSELVGGMYVQIERVSSDKFPNVEIEVRVEDRNRNPIVGLKESNFLVTEENRPVTKMKLAGSAYLNDTCDVTVLIDRSPASDAAMGEIRNAVSEIAQAMEGKGTLRIVSAGTVPVQEGAGPPDTGTWSALRLKAPAAAQWAFDLGLRLSVNDLVNASKKRAVVFLSTGDVPQSGFRRYGLNDLAAYMSNNGVQFSVVYLTRTGKVGEYEYLVDSTGGKSYFVYRAEGLKAVVRDIVDAPNGSYAISYVSTLPTDFGRKFLPVEVEAYLMSRSGRDETGYFAPLE